MQASDTIPITSISFGERGRTTYEGIPELAQSIADNGLGQPIVVTPYIVEVGPRDVDGELMHSLAQMETHYNLIAGGRRLTALLSLGVAELHHGVSFDPLRPGYILAGEADPLTQTLREIAENLDRHSLPWRDEVALIVKAYNLAKAQDSIDGIYRTQRHYGAMVLGAGYSDLKAALLVHEDVTQNPARYVDCRSISAAYSILLKVNANAVSKLAHERGLSELPPLIDEGEIPLPVLGEKPPERPLELPGEQTQVVAVVGEQVERPTIPLSKSFVHMNGLDFMEQSAPDVFDHIVTDPDYAVSLERLSAGVAGAHEGVHQGSVTESLSDLYRFLPLAFKVIKDRGFCVFFYDIDHHEKLRDAAIAAGFLVQRWPLTWRKIDYRSNAAPNHNFCKNVEWAMVCRKPSATLAQVQMSSIYDTMAGKVTKELGHPFAKPFNLWKWIYAGVAHKGQVIFDPFVGCGSSAIAALQWGLRPVGCEVNPDHYHNLMMNLQMAYKKQLGDTVKFS